MGYGDGVMQAAERVDNVILIVKGQDLVRLAILQQGPAVVDVPEAAAESVERHDQ